MWPGSAPNPLTLGEVPSRPRAAHLALQAGVPRRAFPPSRRVGRTGLGVVVGDCYDIDTWPACNGGVFTQTPADQPGPKPPPRARLPDHRHLPAPPDLSTVQFR